MAPQKVILDVDTGTDDAVALMVAALSPDLELVGVTTVNGNCPVHICTENTLRVLDHIDRSIPVYEGCALPLVSTLTPGRRPNIPYVIPSPIHGHYLDLPPARSPKQPQHAVDWLIDTLLGSAGDIVLVPVGPLTNIAMAMRKEPRILDKIPEIVIMGGGHAVSNVTAAAEFNIWVDPEAARLVLGCGRPIRLVTLDATHRALVSQDDCALLRALGTPAAATAAGLIEHRIRAYDKTRTLARSDAAPVHDALTVCAVLDPSVIQSVFVYVDVETRGELTDGRTVCDMQNSSRRPPNVHVAINADTIKFVRMLEKILG